MLKILLTADNKICGCLGPIRPSIGGDSQSSALSVFVRLVFSITALRTTTAPHGRLAKAVTLADNSGAKPVSLFWVNPMFIQTIISQPQNGLL